MTAPAPAPPGFGKVLVTVPTYDEAESIAALIADILSRGAHYEVLVADDDSPDGTWRLVADLAAHDPRVHLLHRTAERGRERAVRDACVRALALGADAVVEMDADYSHHPRHIPKLLQALEHADVVVGSRQAPGGLDLGRSRPRVWLTRARCALARRMLALTVRDCSSGFRAFRREALQRMGVEHARAVGPSLVHELLLRAQRAGLRVVEVPIAYRARELGRSTRGLGDRLAACRALFALRRAARRGELDAELNASPGASGQSTAPAPRDTAEVLIASGGDEAP